MSILELNSSGCNYRLRQILEIFPFACNDIVLLTRAEVVAESGRPTDAINVVKNVHYTESRSSSIDCLDFCHFHVRYVKLEASLDWHFTTLFKTCNEINIFAIDLNDFRPNLINFV